MPTFPDRFDLGVLRAREKIPPERQADFLLGWMMALPAWYFLNLDGAEPPQPCTVMADEEKPGDRQLLVFTDRARLEIIAEEIHPLNNPGSLEIALLPGEAFPWVLAQRVAGLLVNPGDYAFLLPRDQMSAYYSAWLERGEKDNIGFWIPNMTTEEEDFWQENGL